MRSKWLFDSFKEFLVAVAVVIVTVSVTASLLLWAAPRAIQIFSK